MDLPRLIAGLSRSSAFPSPVERVEVIHTHISVVFLAGKDVFKVKKPILLDFLDFSTLEKRRHFCEEEVRLNRRLAPAVYRGVVPVTRHNDSLRFGGAGEIVEWAVHMERLPDDARIRDRIERGAATEEEVVRLARRLAAFHAGAESGPEVARLARFDGVARNVRDALEIPASQRGVTVSRAVHDRLRALTEAALTRARPRIDARAERGIPRDCHGDLHLDHVYFFPERPPPGDLLAVDCIEFNERFRFIDPVADMAFAYMDLVLLGREDLARAFRSAYFDACGDAEGETLLPLYVSYRAAVRGKVEGIKMEEAEVPESARAAAGATSSAHWQLALGALEAPARRPGLVLVGGLPGTGKSTLARTLGERAGFEVIRSDVVRKELARAAGASAQVLYTPEWTERTYGACFAQAQAALFEGKRVLVDATFQRERWRQRFLETARYGGVPAVFLHCTAAPALIRERLAARQNDVSDADWDVYQLAAERWEAPGETTRRRMREIPTDDSSGMARALAALAEEGLAE